MEHVLDNPIFNALISGNSSLALGSGNTLYFPEEISPFVGLKNFSVEEFEMLAGEFPGGTTRATFAPRQVNLPEVWIRSGGMEIYQMVHEGLLPTADSQHAVSPLSDEHIDAMLELTKLTNPGPFNRRTIDFGNYYGCFENERLVAMAGHRLQLPDYTEISAVCAHPAYHGKGYAKTLLAFHIMQIIRSGKTPMLHVKMDNVTAIALYKSLGFRIRRSIDVVIFRKSD
jgi:ribosomal protein S18 acetylase RimI-like enzyme